MKHLLTLLGTGSLLAVAACNNASRNNAADSTVVADRGDTTGNIVDTTDLPAPYATKSVKNYSEVLGWPADKKPVPPAGFTVTKFSDSLINPRWIYIAPNGDVLVAEANTRMGPIERVKSIATGKEQSGYETSSADRITLFRDTTKDGVPDLRTIFMDDLDQPFGMLILDDKFYVANTGELLVFPYQQGQTSISGKGKKILDLPKGGYNNHWTRNIIASADGSKIYIAVGSASNAAEHGMKEEVRRANILEINPDGSGERVYASGLRNPVGMDWAPGTNVLWTVVNERDELGDHLVPDYLTHVEPGGFYGWPYSYFGGHIDPQVKVTPRPDLVSQALVPDVPLPSHTASLGLTFYDGSTFPDRYRSGAFIGQRGSWNSSVLAGYKVVFVPFSNGQPAGPPENFLTGFIADSADARVYGRPVGVAVAADGALLVADDAGNTVWRVSHTSNN
ncbi:PQQ-dependent sugar dehydrogenase [Chitinophaga japonensis]|uniref:Glucose/arabinose dehydrogenase n=1 Tax=Chitinophaga japonensis TaxID=104662 RepID=A0A562T2W4_CHIJA|nr:sorbosone dehydrogenase family protein [Chitinophaga japonensis]TWI87965.1 glucose/arabinose dehydrogenase [Chitinophaga japonensis]